MRGDRAREVLAIRSGWAKFSPSHVVTSTNAVRAMLTYAAECIAAERERAAKVAEDWSPTLTGDPMQDHMPIEPEEMSIGIAAAIRAGV